MAIEQHNTSQLIPFVFENHPLSVITHDNGESWFIAKEVCDILGLENVSQAVSRLDADEKGIYIADTPGGPQESLIISEPGFYRLTGGSRKAVAKRFQRWVFHDVLTQIRKTGKYEPATPFPPVTPSYRERIEDLSLCADFLQAMGIFDDRDRLALGDLARTGVQQRYALSTGAAPALPMPQGFFLADRVAELGYRLSRKEGESLLAVGLSKAVAAEYRKSHNGNNPIKTQRFVDGAVRPVNWYRQDDAAWIDAMIQAACAQKGFVISSAPREETP